MFATRSLLIFAERSPILCLPRWVGLALQHHYVALLVFSVVHGLAASFSISFLIHAEWLCFAIAMPLAIVAFLEGRKYFDRAVQHSVLPDKMYDAEDLSMWSQAVLLLALPLLFVLKTTRIYSRSTEVESSRSARYVGFLIKCFCWIPPGCFIAGVAKAVVDPSRIERLTNAPLLTELLLFLQRRGGQGMPSLWLNYVLFVILLLAGLVVVSWILWFLLGVILRILVVVSCMLIFNRPHLIAPALGGLSWIVSLLEAIGWPGESISRMRLLLNVQCDGATWGSCKASLIQTAFGQILAVIENELSHSALRLLKQWIRLGALLISLLLMATAGSVWSEPRSVAQYNFYFLAYSWLSYCWLLVVMSRE